MAHSDFHSEYIEGCFGCKVDSLRVGYCRSLVGQDKTRANHIEGELAMYEKAVRSGIQPESTRYPDIIRAQEWSEKHSTGFSFEKARAKNKEILLEKVVD